MTFSLTWLPAALRGAGLKVAEVEGWENRGLAEFGPLRGILCHHTAGPKTGNMPSLRTLIDGRADLPGPLAQLGLGRDGTFYVVAAGRCNHAGAGCWGGVRTANSNFIGIEAENTGLPNDLPWPEIQMDAYRHGVAALLAHARLPADMCAGHKEYALPAGRKRDPDFDMAVFRKGVAAILSGATAPLALIPNQEPDGEQRPTLRRGDGGDFVRQLNAALGRPNASDVLDSQTEAAVRVFQRNADLVPDGIVGPKTWAKLVARRAA